MRNPPSHRLPQASSWRAVLASRRLEPWTHTPTPKAGKHKGKQDSNRHNSKFGKQSISLRLGARSQDHSVAPPPTKANTRTERPSMVDWYNENESCDVLCVDAAVGRQKTSSSAVRGRAAGVGLGRIVTVGLNRWPQDLKTRPYAELEIVLPQRRPHRTLNRSARRLTPARILRSHLANKTASCRMHSECCHRS